MAGDRRLRMNKVVSCYDNGHGWRIAFEFQGARRIITVDQAVELKRGLDWALGEIASQPIIQADAEKY